MKKIIVAVLSLFVAFQGLSAASPDEILNRIEKANSAQSCVTSSFRHTKVLATKAKKTMEGSQYYVSPDKLAMVYSNPAGDRFTINGNRVYMNRAGKSQVYDITKVPMVKRLSSSILDAVCGKVRKLAGNNNADMKVMDSGSSYIITMTARQEASTGYARTTLEYRKSDCILVKLELEEFTHVVNSFSFDGISTTSSIDKAVFEIPAR